MRKIIFGISLFSLFAFTTVSCNNNDDDTNTAQIIDLNALPAEARSFVTTYFSGTEIARIEKHNPMKVDGTMYEVDFVNRDEVDFDQKGIWLKVEAEGNRSISTDFILPSILSYVKTNYPTLEINKIEKEMNGFEVELKNDLDLKINSNGEFVSIKH